MTTTLRTPGVAGTPGPAEAATAPAAGSAGSAGSVAPPQLALRSLDAGWNRTRWERLSADGKRYEVIDGVLYVTTAPSSFHQWILKQLYQALYTVASVWGGRRARVAGATGAAGGGGTLRRRTRYVAVSPSANGRRGASASRWRAGRV